MTIEVIAFILGAIFLVTGILGGGIELKELKIPSVSNKIRFLASTCGLVFMGLGLWLYLSKRDDPKEKTVLVADASKKESVPLSAATLKSEPLQTKTEESAPNESEIMESTKADLKSAIRRADNAESEAQFSYNTDPLYKAYIGEGLNTELASIEDLKRNGVYVSSTLEKQEFLTFNISKDSKEAEVRVIETWSVVYYSNSTKKCIGKIPSSTAPQSIFLKKGEMGWLVTSVVQDKLESPPLGPCD